MNKDTLFEMLDNELEADQIEDAVEQLLDDPELQQSWHQQYLIRAAIRDRALIGQCDMVERVASALEDEAVIDAPDNLAEAAAQGAMADSGDGKVVYPNAWRRRYLGYAAVAASLLAVVLINLPQQPQETPGIADTGTTQAITPAAEQELQAMIVQHGEFSGAAALNGLVAYSKVVTAGAPTAGAARR